METDGSERLATVMSGVREEWKMGVKMRCMDERKSLDEMGGMVNEEVEVEKRKPR